MQIINMTKLRLNVNASYNKILIESIQNQWHEKIQNFFRLGEIVFSPTVLKHSYMEMIKMKAMNIKTITHLNEMSIEKFEQLSEKLFSYTWEIDKSKIVIISKTKARFSPVTFILDDDKIISNALKITLDIIYQNQFKKLTFKVKKNTFKKSKDKCHTILQAVIDWGIIDWYIKVDMGKHYDVITLAKLIFMFKGVIKCDLSLDIICKLFKISISKNKKEGLIFPKNIGILRSNALSLVLVNFYFHRLDTTVKILQKEIQGSQYFGSNRFQQWRKVTTAKATGIKTCKAKRLFRKKMRTPPKVRDCISKKIEVNKKYSLYQLFYARYGRNFLIGIKGPKLLAQQCLVKIKMVLIHGLSFMSPKGQITHGRGSKITFLGFELKFSCEKNLKGAAINQEVIFNRLRVRILNRIRIHEEKWRKLTKQLEKERVMKNVKVLLGPDINSGKKQMLRGIAKISAMKMVEAIEKQNLTSFHIPNSLTIEKWAIENYESLKQSFIEEEMLNKFGYEETVKVYQAFKSQLEKIGTKCYAAVIKKEKIDLEKGTVNNTQYVLTQSTKLKSYVPLLLIRRLFEEWGFVKKKKFSPKSNGAAFKYSDIAIINYYNEKGLGLLEYYCPTANFHLLKAMVNYQMRWSLIYTLAGKHVQKSYVIIRKYGKSPTVIVCNEKGEKQILATFLTPNNINHR